MKKLLHISLVLFFSFLLTNCASIVSKSHYPVSINSSPSEATITITNRKVVPIYKGNTPAVVELVAGSGFFTKENYQVKFEKEGYQTKIIPIMTKLDDWYFGNILFGGFIGMLIIDPATGAMYKISTKYLNETLYPVGQIGYNVIDINDVPEALIPHLVLIEE